MKILTLNSNCAKILLLKTFGGFIMANTFSSRIKEIFYGTKDWKQIEQNQFAQKALNLMN